jgi:lysophospholipase L1-like esterase
VRRHVAIVSLLSALLTTGAAALVAPTASASPGTYVALGDSYTASPLTGSLVGSPAGCLRSSNNYPRVARPSIGLDTFVDVSCSGAKTDDFFAPQSVTGGTNPPQLDAVTSAARAVSIGIGGNDIGFSEIVQSCLGINPFATPCRDRYIVNGVDTLAARINATAPKVANALAATRQRAPFAAIYLVGYPALVPNSGFGCWPTVPISPLDVTYLRATTQRLNGMLATQAAAAGARYVDVYTPSIGHDLCASSSVRWVEGLFPSSPAAPFHPNARGSAGMGAALAAAAH